MNYIRKYKILVLLPLLLLFFTAVSPQVKVSAVTTCGDTGASCYDGSPTACPAGQTKVKTDTSVVATCCPNTVASTPADKLARACFIAKYLNPVINLLTALVGMAVMVGVIWGAIEVTQSGGDPQKSASGKKHIRAALIGLLAYLFLYGFLQFLLPGGSFN